uniref:Thioredoxin domain-containing protein n=1 Tax=Glossina pallidipes TaxID=7398 RepID=A0A1A9Z7Z6_GLOPL
MVMYIILFTSISYALYMPQDDVVELNSSNFEIVLKDPNIWIIEFYAPWCGQCVKFMPKYRTLAKNLRGLIRVGAINGDLYPQLIKQYNVKAYPTIKIFGIYKNSPIDFKGKRTVVNLQRAALVELKKLILFGVINTAIQNEPRC